MNSSSFIRIIFFIFLYLFFYLNTSSAQINKPLAEIGQSNYLEGNYKDAAKNFNSAMEESPNDASLVYNLANSQYKQGKFDESLQYFNQAATLSQSPKLKQKAYYNSGNSLFNLRKFKQAIDSYKKALELDPNDFDTKYNLEFSRKQLQKNDKKKPSNNKDKNSKKQDPKDSDSKKKNEKSNENQKSNSKQNNNKKTSYFKKPEPIENKLKNSEDNQDAENKKINTSSNAEDHQPKGLSKKQAEQWLLSINENRKKFGQIKAKKLKPNPEYRGKDW